MDDEKDIRDVLADVLQQQGYRVTKAANGAELFAAGPSELAIIDLRLDNEDGLTLAKSLRAQSAIPIMMLTGKGDETDIIIGLEVAADDYMMKPFNLREFTARVNALLRRSNTSFRSDTSTGQISTVDCEETLYQFDDWTLNLSQRTVTHLNGSQPTLTHGEFSLLEVLVTSPRRVLSREHLMERTHGYGSDSQDRTIDVLIVRLRRKIEKTLAFLS
nr:response regulator transcription factor [Enterovibrio nigricans]